MTDSTKLDLILEKINTVEEKVNAVEREVKDLKRQQMKNTAELKAMDSMILDEVERVHEIMLKRTDDLQKRIG